MFLFGNGFYKDSLPYFEQAENLQPRSPWPYFQGFILARSNPELVLALL